MKPSNVDELIREKEELWDLLEDMILETSGMRLR